MGYVGSEEASSILLEALRKLEYRGYDSAGIALVDEHNKGRLSNLELLVQQKPIAVSAVSHIQGGRLMGSLPT